MKFVPSSRMSLVCVLALLSTTTSRGTLITDPNDARTWQGATVGTFAALYYGSDTPANRQLVVNQQLLDDGIFDPTGFTQSTLLPTTWSTTPGAGGCIGQSTDNTGVGGYDYYCGATDLFTAANSVDDLWYQTSGVIGDTVYDLGFDASHAAIFNTIDHGPMPQEAIESTIYLSNDQVNWTQADVKRVWLEGFKQNLGIEWDGFAYVVGTPNNVTFRYASVIHGGPGALQQDGDNEINGILGLMNVPEPATASLFALAAIALIRRRTN